MIKKKTLSLISMANILAISSLGDGKTEPKNYPIRKDQRTELMLMRRSVTDG